MRRIFLLVAALTIAFAFSHGVMADESGIPPGLLRAKAAQESHTPTLLMNPDVVGTALGIEAGTPVIKVLLKRLGAIGIPNQIEGIRVVPLVTGTIVALKRPETSIDRTAHFDRPVPIGVSTGHPDITAGTIGCRVKDAGNVYALSNNHVYANENRAVFGDNVLQPGPYDGGLEPNDSIGTLFKFGTIKFETTSESPVNYIDAAIAASSEEWLGTSTPSDGYGRPKSSPAEPVVGVWVMKYGRTTGLTKGQIDAINAIVRVSYDQGIALFAEQIIIKPGKFSSGGDSGSLIVVNDVTVSGKGKNQTITEGPEHRKPMGLLFAGSTVVTIANPIQKVLDYFQVTVDGE